MTIEVKICGLSTPETVAAAVAGGARSVGFVFYPGSPRSVSPQEAGRLSAAVPAGITRVGVVVDRNDADLEDIVAGAGLDMLQLHGAETPGRAAEIKGRFGLAVMKAVSIAGAQDVAGARAYEDVVDRLMFDAKPPKDGAALPGGNALAFDWELLGGHQWQKPWTLAGGLDADNVAAAVRASGARAVDVSSGVEERPGVKSVDKIGAFLAVARDL